MAKVLVVFGSKSDSSVFEPLMEKFKEKGIEARVEVCSAHRDPKRLIEMLENADEKVVVAGAGLSAALPGFIASHSEKLVIGVPVSGNYAGLDALLSIHQMPKGFTVLGTGVEALDETVKATEKVLNGKEKIVAFKPGSEEGLKRFDACKAKLEELGTEFEVQENVDYKDDKTVYIDFIELDNTAEIDDKGKLVLFVPIKKGSTEQDALKLLSLSKKGVWLGLGRGENAALCAAKIVKGE